MRTGLFIVPLTWEAIGIGFDGKPTNSLPIWISCQVGNTPGSGGSLPYLETPPNTVATVCFVPEARWDIVIGTPEWQLVHEYEANQIASLSIAPVMIGSICRTKDVSRRTLLVIIGMLAASALLLKAADKPITTANKDKITKYLEDRKEAKWTKEKLDKIKASKATTTKAFANEIVSDLFAWPLITRMNCKLT